MKSTRREILAAPGLVFPALIAFRKDAIASPHGLPVGLQPYTVRNEMQRDFDGTLKRIAAMGYKLIEISQDFYGQTPQHVHDIMHSLGFGTPACHCPHPKSDADWEKSIEYARSFDAKYILTTTRGEWSRSLDGWRKTADFFNRLGSVSRKAGLRLAYHNHNFEFTAYDGAVAYDELLRLTDPEFVTFEMDCFWTVAAGKDPVVYFEKHPGRFPLLHIKDLKPGYQPSTGRMPGNPFIEVGSGIIDWKRIFKAAPKGGLAHFFVEQDNWDRPELDSAAISCAYLKNLTV